MPTCPVCEGDAFSPDMACMSCGANEQDRMLAVMLRRVDVGLPLGPVVHASPKPGMVRIMRRRFGGHYRAISPSELMSLAPSSVFGVIRSHIDGDTAIINRAIIPGGFHLFQAVKWRGEDFSGFVHKAPFARVTKEDAAEFSIPFAAVCRNTEATAHLFVKAKQRGWP